MPSQTSNPNGGRPRVAEYDSLFKYCEACGQAFHLRDRRFQSYNKFMKRRFCSPQCVSIGARACRREYTTEEEKKYIIDRVSVSENGCWNWQLRTSHNGYGLTQRKGLDLRVHRYAFELWKGEIPEGMLILHSCDNRKCCNPEHLRIGTAKENVADAIERGRWPRAERAAA